MFKKALFAILILPIAGILHADQDSRGSMREAVWRSSLTQTADTNVSVASGAINLRGVIIGTSTPNSGIFIYDNSAFTTVFTTKSVLDCSQGSSRLVVFDITLSSGLGYTTTGNCSAVFLWDWTKTKYPR